jgi:hypothetical protein
MKVYLMLGTVGWNILFVCVPYIQNLSVNRYTSVVRRQVIVKLMPQPCMQTVQGRGV